MPFGVDSRYISIDWLGYVRNKRGHCSSTGRIPYNRQGEMSMRRFLVLLASGLAVAAVAALDKPTPPDKPFYTEFAVYIGNKLSMTVRYWQDGENIRRDYEDRLPKTFLTTKDGTYIIVNHQDRGMRINNTAKMLEGKRIEDYAQWPMWDVEWFIKSFNAKKGEETTITYGGKSVKAIPYTYKLKGGPPTTGTLWVSKDKREPLRAMWGKNENVGIPPSQLKPNQKVSYQTKIEYHKYVLGEPIRAELFKAPSYVLDGGDGKNLTGPTDNTPPGPGK
jgi:hypothetical protein